MKYSKRSRTNPRTLKTYQNKIRKLESKYKRLYNHSKISKENKPKNKVYFCDKYPTFKDFLKIHKLREVGKTKVIKPTITTINTTRKLGIWGT